MVSINRLHCGLVVLLVQIIHALSFSFGRKEERTDPVMEKHGMLAQMGGFFNKLTGKDKSINTVEHMHKVENAMPTQLRSLDVKASSKQWIPHGGCAVRATIPSTINPDSIATGNMNDMELMEENVWPGPTLQYVDAGLERTNNRPSFFSSDTSSVRHLNALLSRHAAATHDASTRDYVSKSQVNATMAFKIEITHNTAEITVSVGSTTEGSAAAATAEATQHASSEHSSPKQYSENKVEADIGHSSKQDPLSVAPDETPSIQAPYIPFIPSNLAEPSHYTPSVFIHNSSAHMMYDSTLPAPHLATSTSVTADLSYMALFCFGLGILCTYALSRLYTAISAWYRGRVPRYIASLEKQSIALLSAHRYAEVKALLTRALPVVEAYKGPKHTDTAAFRHFLAKALLALGERAAARAHLRCVVGIYEAFGEDLYMAHALEDLALAQQEQEQEHAAGSNVDSSGGDDDVTAGQNTIALGTMRRALRIFTEEALALEAIGRQTAALQQREGESEECSDGEKEGSVCYVSSPSCTDTTCDSPSLASSTASLGTSATPGLFTIRSSSGAGSRVSGSCAGSALWERELLTAVSDGEEEMSEVEQGGAGCSREANSDSDDELRYSICGEGTQLTHSLDSQDPHSPIYKSDSSWKAVEMCAHNTNNTASTSGGEKSVLGELRVRGGGGSSPFKRSAVSPVRTGVFPGRAATSTSTISNAGKKGKSGGKRGSNGGSNSSGGSPDNENTNPNNKSKPFHRASSAVGAKSALAVPIIYGTIFHTVPTPISTSTPLSPSVPDSTTAATPEEVSLRTALADLERLLAEPGPSPNTLIGPTALSPESVLFDYSVDYDAYPGGVGVCGGAGRDDTTNMSTSSGYINNYTEVYDCFSSAVKATSNPMCADPHTPSVVRDLNVLLSRTPGHERVAKGGDFGPIECVKDPHVGRVLHRVASLLGRLGRHAESAAYLHVASCVYCMLYGAEADQVSALKAEIARVNCLVVDVLKNDSDDMSMLDMDVSSVYSVYSAGSETPSAGVKTPFTSPPPRRRGRKSKK